MHWMGKGRRGRNFLLVAAVVVGAFAFAGVFGFVVMSLWNWLTPALFGWRAITFWQALGLLVLCRILFGGFGGGSARRSRRRRMEERWEQMIPEEREKFREGLKARCGAVEPARPEPGA